MTFDIPKFASFCRTERFRRSKVNIGRSKVNIGRSKVTTPPTTTTTTTTTTATTTPAPAPATPTHSKLQGLRGVCVVAKRTSLLTPKHAQKGKFGRD